MSLKSPPPRDSDGDEISVVIKALRAADLRLEELTSGEIDTVSDHDGRSFLLQRAQNQLREAEAAKQAAILNALPAYIAVLDMAGRVLSVNEMWERATADNTLHGPAYGVGINYLEKCEKARGPDSIEARRAATGIRSVLSGVQKRFAMQYPCNMPTGRYWFLLTTTPLATRHPRGAVIMHVDITDQKHSEAALRRFAAAMDATTDALFLVDRSSMRYIHVNEAACRIQAQTRTALLASSPAHVLGVPQKELEETYDRLIQSGVDARPVEVLRRRSDGSNACFELRRHAHPSGDSWTIVSIMRDVTDRKEAETRIVQLNRVHAMLSGINALIVRAHDRNELFSEACRIATDDGGFKMIWIGLVDPTGQKIIPVASVGVREEFIAEIRDKFSLQEGNPRGQTMTARAVREGKPCVANDLEASSDVLYRKEHLAVGIRSMAVLPLIIDGAVVGVVALYAYEIEFFHSGEMRLLTGLTGDIAFAIDHIEKQERLDYLAYYDVLTGLANRALFLERMAQYIRGAASGRAQISPVFSRFRAFQEYQRQPRPAGRRSAPQTVTAWLTHI